MVPFSSGMFGILFFLGKLLRIWFHSAVECLEHCSIQKNIARNMDPFSSGMLIILFHLGDPARNMVPFHSAVECSEYFSIQENIARSTVPFISGMLGIFFHPGESGLEYGYIQQ